MSSQHQLVLEGKIVDLDDIYESRIGIDDGIIKEISPDIKINGSIFIPLEKELIFPGFIDTHVHPRVPGGEHKEDFEHFSRAALHGGVTTAMCMLNTEPPGTTKKVLQDVKKRASRESLIDLKFFALALYDNLHELESLASYCIGYKIYLTESTGGYTFPIDYLQHALTRISAVGKPLTIHYEGNDIEEQVLCQLQNFDRVNIAHISTAEVLKAIEKYKKNGYNIVCELTPHHAFLTKDDEKTLGSYAKMIPPLETEEDRLILINGLNRGAIDFYATDHAPHTIEEKMSKNPPSGVPGLDTYGNTVAFMINQYGISPQRMMQATSYNAAKFFGLDDRGRIEVGKRADITVLDLESPEIITAKNLYTKCGWSPFDGWVFPGRVEYTIHNGKIMAKNGIVI
jgi:dihydroorotase-like cyclic amidohydrolase